MKAPPAKAIREALVYYLVGLYRRIDEHHLLLLGGGLTFSLFLCIVPFVLVLFFALGKILETASVETRLSALVDMVIPYTSQASFVKMILFSPTTGVARNNNAYGVVGILGLLFSASGLFRSMRTILNKVYRIEGMSVFRSKPRDFGILFAILSAFLVALVFLPPLEALKDSSLTGALIKLFIEGAITSFIYSLLSSLVIFAIFFVLYTLIPHARLGRKVVLLSALWATLLWEFAKQVFGYYLNHFASIERIYGAYMLMVVVAFWIYYSSVIFILGAVIGQLYRERARRPPGP
jgi:membrane protein